MESNSMTQLFAGKNNDTPVGDHHHITKGYIVQHENQSQRIIVHEASILHQ